MAVFALYRVNKQKFHFDGYHEGRSKLATVNKMGSTYQIKLGITFPSPDTTCLSTLKPSTGSIFTILLPNDNHQTEKYSDCKLVKVHMMLGAIFETLKEPTIWERL
ncbi:hypothetical protein HQ560_18990 [bacterium]|nr:hypothetical protein [bacterium]